MKREIKEQKRKQKRKEKEKENINKRGVKFKTIEWYNE